MIRRIAKHRAFKAVMAATVTVLFASWVSAKEPSARAAQNPPPPPPAQGQGTDQNLPPPPPSNYQGEQHYNQPGPRAQGPMLAPRDLDQLVSRIALYPDSLLAQILAASTYWNEIPDAANWADQHVRLRGDELANAIREDNLDFDASVVALLPFPSVLDMMARDPGWTQQLGNAVLSQHDQVMDSVQAMRSEAYNYGYLRTNPYDTVTEAGGYVQITPANPAYLYVPTYDPAIVFGAPRPGFSINSAIGFGPAVVIGGGFAPWGWAHPYMGWRDHAIFFDDRPFGRTWGNRGRYVHPYERPYVRREGPRTEQHDFGRDGRRDGGRDGHRG